jgi:hypothetical protein
MDDRGEPIKIGLSIFDFLSVSGIAANQKNQIFQKHHQF